MIMTVFNYAITLKIGKVYSVLEKAVNFNHL